MKRLIIDDSLLLTDIELIFKGNSLFLKRVLVDTGSGSTIISADLGQSIGIVPEEDDQIFRIIGVGGSEFVYSKVIDCIKIGDIKIKNFMIEIGAMNYGFDLDGIFGLDKLKQIKAIININKLTLKSDFER